MGSQLPGLNHYRRELENMSKHSFSFCLNATLSVLDVGFPDILFINCGRNELFGLNELRKIKKLNSKTLVVMAISANDIKIGRHAIKRGALTYLIKDEQEPEQVKRIIELCSVLINKRLSTEFTTPHMVDPFFKNTLLPLKRFFHF